ncbi:MAG: sigma-70 family RNA polymerase sigma factor [Acidimicrobiia bacterium]|jgi:RNA polymerase sigma-70 factor (ECF subfamily)
MTLGVSFESVVAAAQAGAPWAWATLYGEIAGPVAGFFSARGVSDTQSATGDVFIELSRNLDSFTGNEEEFQTFVFAMVYRRLRVEERNPRHVPRSALADRVLDRVQNDLQFEIDLSQSQISDSVKSAFKALAPDQRDVLSLRVVAGLTIEQTAQVIGRSVSAVQSLQRKALGRARHVLSDPPIPKPVVVP